jgi:hypothetical protein
VVLAQQLLLLLHLIGFAALFGGYLVQLRLSEPEINVAMLHGSWIAVASGAGLYALDFLAARPVDLTPLVIKAVLSLFVLILVIKNRKYASIPRGLGLLIGGLTLGVAAVAVLWP